MHISTINSAGDTSHTATAEHERQAATFRKAYQDARLPERFNEQAVPRDLLRGAKESRVAELGGNMAVAKAISLEPRVEKTVLSADGKIAFTSQDVEIEILNGAPLGAGLHHDARRGPALGISLFDRIPSYAQSGGWRYLKMPAGSPIAEALAVTQDSANKDKSNHRTVAPKWDMPLGLFMEWLSMLAKHVNVWAAQ